VRTFIGLGGNIGDARSVFGSAVAELRALGAIGAVSSLYVSEPRDVHDQPEFTNAALELETELQPGPLLLALKGIERRLGRDPDGRRWGPRTMDLDILAFDGRCIEDPELDLVVPHPRLPQRRFVLEPLAELDPDFKPWRNCSDLRHEVTVGDLLPSVAEQPVRRIGGADWADPRPV
jgi:2-amino-4-hydroxy-6-hydroxymethyldihydropteridine diphosphokinase